jgi:peptidoglycan/LPS O-acetylase OafA/YrhL
LTGIAASRLRWGVVISTNLDLIRATAVLCVFFAHLNENYFRTHGHPHFVSEWSWHFGQMGVLIFFVHTSFVLMQSLERDGGNKTKFYIRRIFRIYPLSIFVVTIAFLLQLHPWTWDQYFANVTLTTNLLYVDDMTPSLWTLPIEVQMYLVLPFLFAFAKPRPAWALGLVWIGAVIAGVMQPHISDRLNVMEFGPCFVAGVMSWRIAKSVRTKMPGIVWPLAFLAVWPVFLIASRAYDDYFRWAFCLALGLAIPWFADLRLSFLNAISHTVAKYSYGIYLTHVAIMSTAFRLPVPIAVQFLILIAGTFFVPFALFHLIEDPLIRMGQGLVSTRRIAAPVMAERQAT